MITFSILYYFARKEGVVSFDISGILKVWVSSTLMFLIVDYVSNLFGPHIYLLPFYIALGAALYIGFARLFRIFKVENKELILSLFPSRLFSVRKILLVLVLH